MLSGLSEEEFRLQTADGLACRKVPVPEVPEGKRFLVNYHGFVRQAMDRGEDVLEMTRRILAAGADIITMDEVGCGIVPIDRAERDYREAVGAAGQLLAANASQVYRIQAGIPVRIR